MIAKWLEQAQSGQTVWLPDVREGCARDHAADAVRRE